MLENRNLDGEDWDSLVYSVKNGQCVVMLGPDAVTAEVDGQSSPILNGLTGFVKRRLKREKPYVDADFDRVSAVAEAAVMAFGDDTGPLLAWVGEFYDRQSFDDPTLAGIARLPVGLVVNTVPGLPVERAFDDAKPGRSVGVYDRHGTTAPLPAWTTDEPLVYHLYGALDQPRSMVLSDRDLLDVLVSVIREDPPLPANLISAIRDPNRTFLFLGFQLYHWQLRVLMHVLDQAAEGTSRRSRSFALEMPTGGLDQGTRNFYSSGHGIDFFDMPASQFVSELLRRVDSEAGAAVAASPVAPDSPAVFLCHADEDKGYADGLAARLRSSGLNTWLDKDDLRGGVSWDALIEDTLRNGVGYVVVLQSRNLVEKRERQQMSYVNKELRIALDRQKYLSPNRIFIVPVIVDDMSSRLSDLSEIQWIDLTDAEGYDKLVSEIKRDIQRGIQRW